jgi:hypothetical protein
VKTSLLKAKHPQLKIISHLLRPTRGGAAGVLILRYVTRLTEDYVADCWR